MADMEFISTGVLDPSVCYFKSKKYKNLAYRLLLRRDVFNMGNIIIGQKGRRKIGKRTDKWIWTNLSARWKIDALILVAWPEWSPDDMG